MKTYEDTIPIFNDYIGFAESQGRWFNTKDPAAGEQSARVALWKYVRNDSVPSSNIPTRYIKNAVMREVIKDKLILATDQQVFEHMKANKWARESGGECESLEDRLAAYDKVKDTRKSKPSTRNVVCKALATHYEVNHQVHSEPAPTDFSTFFSEVIPDDMPEDLKETIKDRAMGFTFEDIGKKQGTSAQAVAQTMKSRMNAWKKTKLSSVNEFLQTLKQSR